MEQISSIAILAWFHTFMRIITGLLAKESKLYALIDVKRVVAVAGKDRRIVLSCPCTKSIPVTWRKNGMILHDSNTTMMSLGSLTVSPVRLSLEGMYECRSEDLFQNGYRAVFNVSIYESPRILQRKKRHLYTNGSSAEFLNCKANGKPKPDVFWINEKGISAINPPSITRISDTTLKVTNLKTGGVKVLICVAQNAHGRVKVKFKVGREAEAAKMPQDKKRTKKILQTTTVSTTMQTTTEAKGRPPWFKNRPSRINYVVLGGKLAIGCDADGVPKPKITISQMRPNKIPLRGTIIPRISAFHLGIYECKASNKHGTIKYPFLIKIRGTRRTIQNYTKKRVRYNKYAVKLGQWTSWSGCSKSCGIGTKIRTRKCTTASARFRERLCYRKSIMRRSCFGGYCRRG